MNKEIINYIEKYIIPQYKNFDKAHNLEHVQTVIKESVELAKNSNADTMLAYVIAAYHDLGLTQSREFHHIFSGKILYNDKILRKWFTEKQMVIMKKAVEDHRASSKTSPRNIYGKIISEADRVIDPVKTIQRTLQFTIKNNPDFSKEDYKKNVIDHLHNKFAEGGYMKLYFENSKNARKLKELRDLIADETRLNKTFEELYTVETKTKNQTAS